MRTREGFSKKRMAVLTALGLCAAMLFTQVFCYAAYNLYHIYTEYKKGSDEYNAIAQMAVTERDPDQDSTSESEEAAGPDGPALKAPLDIDFDSLRSINTDVIGWIYVEALDGVSYPVVKGTDNDQYLHMTYEKNYNFAGTIFIDYENKADFSDCNTLVYGHNMKNGSMFKDVNRYKDEAYFKEHQFFTIYTPEREIRLKSVAAYYGEAKPIVRKTRFKSQESFDAFVKEMLSPCAYAEPVQYPARTLYTLVTCSYEINDARTFLFAVEVDEDGNEIPPDEAFQERQLDLVRKYAEEQAKQESAAQSNP